MQQTDIQRLERQTMILFHISDSLLSIKPINMQLILLYCLNVAFGLICCTSRCVLEWVCQSINVQHILADNSGVCMSWNYVTEVTYVSLSILCACVCGL